jgi:hypothetical protein
VCDLHGFAETIADKCARADRSSRSRY